MSLAALPGRAVRAAERADAWQHVPAWRPNTHLFGDTRTSSDEAVAGVVADASGVIRARPVRVVRPTDVEELRAAIDDAREQGLRVTVAGTRHSGGGQSLVDGTVLLDMRSMDGLRYDAATGTLDVQPGATWEQVQRYLDGHGRAVAVAQSSSVFSVGGSVSTNIHGRDVRFGPIIDTVESVKVLLADGREVTASRTQEPDLFREVVGGYGQAGVITQARIGTVANEQLRRVQARIAVDELPTFFRATASDPDSRLLQVRLPVTRRGRFAKALAIEHRRMPGAPLVPMRPRRYSPVRGAISRAAFRSAIHTESGKRLLWTIQRRFGDRERAGSRNDVMNPDAEFLRSSSKAHHQVLQEYFIPPERIAAFLGQLSRSVDEHGANLLNVTLRWTPREQTASALPYAVRDLIAAVLYLDQRAGPAAQAGMDRFTRAAADAALSEGGRFYLPYQLDAFTASQLDAAYPGRAAFGAATRRWDPDGRFAGAIEHIDPSHDAARRAR